MDHADGQGHSTAAAGPATAEPAIAEAVSLRLPAARQLAATVWGRRSLIVQAVAAALCLSAGAALVRTNQYTATVLLMPPDAQTLSTTSSLAALSGSQLVGGFAGGGGLLNARTPGSTVVGILGSRALNDRIVERFHLTEVFHVRYVQDARTRLKHATDVAEDKKSGLVSLAVTTGDPARSRDIANAYVEELDRALSKVNTSSAHRERAFLEGRLHTLKLQIDDLAEQLSSFSSRTATLNPQAQGQALFESLGKLEAELSAARAEQAGLQSTYSDSNVRVRAAKARVATLSGEVGMMAGSSSTSDAAKQPFPTLRQLPSVGVTYNALSQQLLAEQAVYATLTKQYELARVEEAKQLPAARVLDDAALPEKPSGLSRAVLILAGTLLGLLGGVVFVCTETALRSQAAAPSGASLRTPTVAAPLSALAP